MIAMIVNDVFALTGLVSLLLLIVSGCGKSAAPTGQGQGQMTLKSSAFKHGRPIPPKYAYRPEGQNVSPPLEWSGVPDGVEQFVLIVDDPDAPNGDWVHWLVYTIPAEARSFPEGRIPDGAAEGLNSWDQTGYGGPLPPPGEPHRYFFKLYALGEKLNLKPGLNKEILREEMLGLVKAQASLMGTYQRDRD